MAPRASSPRRGARDCADAASCLKSVFQPEQALPRIPSASTFQACSPVEQACKEYMTQISVRRGLTWMALSQGGGFVIGLAGSIAIARLLTPWEMGVYAVAAAIVGLLAVLRSFGLSNFLIRETELFPAVMATAFTINAGLSLLSASLLFGLSEFAGAGLGDVGTKRVLHVLSLSPLFTIFAFLPSARLERNGGFRLIGLVNLACGAVNTGLTLFLAFNGLSYMSIAWGNLAASAFGALCLNVVGWRFVSLRVGLSDWRRVGTFGLQMLTLSGVMSAADRLPDLLLGRIAGLAALGLYSRAAGLHSMLWDNLHLMIGRIVFVDFAERCRRGMSLRDSYLRIIAMLTALLWPAFAGLAILSGPVVHTLYGANWISAALPLSLLSMAGLLLTAVSMVWEIYMVRREAAAQLRFQLKRTAISLMLFSLGCLGGLVWAAASRIADAVVTILLCKDDLRRMTDTRVSDYQPIYLQSAGLTVVACGPTALLMAANSWSEQTSLPAIFASVAVGVCGWLAGLWMLQHPLADELRLLRGRIFHALGLTG